MLFNSYVFAFAFLPVVLAGYYAIGRRSHSSAALWLTAASLFFYGWWDARYLALLGGSIAFNYAAGVAIVRRTPLHSRRRQIALATAVACNLAVLIYFKYARFFVDNIDPLTGWNLSLATVVLPLGISFFTFTQIAFLVDSYQGKVDEPDFVRYALFVTWFPHLIAGPVLHHAEMMPQFARPDVCRVDWNHLAVGLSIFMLGLAKKVLLADGLADFANPVFAAVEGGGHPMFFEAWIGALSYALQLYFDFSGYCDMAIGLSLMFNVRLPMNFDSPYKATSIIDFWRRWHMTLSRFLRDYLYVPLGGSRLGTPRRYVNLMITMLLGGLWHGAGWTFVAWGAVHGGYLLVNHAWRGIGRHRGRGRNGRWATLASGALTFVAVVVAWVFFRADSLSSAFTVLHSMAGGSGLSLPAGLASRLGGVSWLQPWLVFDGLWRFGETGPMVIVPIGLAIVWLLPNVPELFRAWRPTCEDLQARPGSHESKRTSPRRWSIASIAWKPNLAWLLGTATLAGCALALLSSHTEFLYFQF